MTWFKEALGTWVGAGLSLRVTEGSPLDDDEYAGEDEDAGALGGCGCSQT